MAAPQRLLDPDGSLLPGTPPLPDDRAKDLFVHMVRLRCLDERMLKLQRAGRVGFVGTAKGL